MGITDRFDTILQDTNNGKYRELSALAIFVDQADCLTIIVNWRGEEQVVESPKIRQTVSTV